MKKIPTQTLNQSQTLFIKSLLKQGYLYQAAKEFVLSSKILDSDFAKVQSWPASGDLFLLQSSANEVQVRRFVGETSVHLDSAASFREAFDQARRLVASTSTSIYRVSAEGFKTLFQAKLRSKSVPISVLNYNSVLNSAFKPSHSLTSNPSFAFGDIIISSSDKGFEVSRMNEHLMEQVHSIHEQYPDALGQALAIVGDHAVWLKSSEGSKLLSASKPSGRYSTSAGSVRKDPPLDFFKEIQIQYLKKDIDRATAKTKMVSKYLEYGWPSSEALKESEKTLHYWDTDYQLRYARNLVDTGMYGVDLTHYAGIEGKDYIDPDMAKRIQDERRNREGLSSASTPECHDVEVFYVEGETPTDSKDNIYSMESVSLPELTDSPTILFVMPNISVPSLFNECDEEGTEGDCTDKPQFLFGDHPCEAAVFLASSKDIPENATILSKKIRFNSACHSRL